MSPSTMRSRWRLEKHRPDPGDVGNRGVSHDGGMIEVTRERFEDLVGEALDTIPEELARLMENVVVLVDDHPPAGRRIRGLYQGVPLTQRGTRYSGMLPDRIHIYRFPIQRMSSSEEDIIEQVRITVVHEVGHHFGIKESRLHELGYG